MQVESYEQGRRDLETFRRIHRLQQRGYRIKWDYGVEDALWMAHPGGGPELLVFPGGTVVASMEAAVLNPSSKQDRYRISNLDIADTKDFDRWLATVRLPSWRERTSADREKYVLQPGCLILFFIATLALGKFIEAAWSVLVRP